MNYCHLYKNKFLNCLLYALLLFLISCSKNEVYTEVPKKSPVVLDLSQIPYTKLSTYNFFTGELKNQNPSEGVLPYKPTSELFTDYAKKIRFIWLPDNTKAAYNNDASILNLPAGAALIKTFFYTNVQPYNTKQIVETRILIKKNNEWVSANYVWNSEQNEAFLDLNGSTKVISWEDENQNIKTVNYQIPSELDCNICHKISGQNTPIGLKPQNLNSNYGYPEGSKNQLLKLIEFGYLENNLPANILSVVDYKDTSKSLNFRVRSYFDANCAHCHQVGGYAGNGFALRFEFSKTNLSANMCVCMPPNHFMPGVINDKIVRIGEANRSMIYQRMITNTPNYRMPFKGRTIVDEEGLLLVEHWINSLTDCN